MIDQFRINLIKSPVVINVISLLNMGDISTFIMKNLQEFNKLAFAKNDGINRIDALGNFSFSKMLQVAKGVAKVVAGTASVISGVAATAGTFGLGTVVGAAAAVGGASAIISGISDIGNAFGMGERLPSTPLALGDHIADTLAGRDVLIPDDWDQTVSLYESVLGAGIAWPLESGWTLVNGVLMLTDVIEEDLKTPCP
jgi:hypothetical protein